MSEDFASENLTRAPTLHADVRKLLRELKNAGLSSRAIDAAWPSWWTEEAGSTPSGRAELRFALAKKLGLSPKSLLGERVEFVWKDDARFKNLTAEGAAERAAIASFGVSVARIMLQATPARTSIQGLDPRFLRELLLDKRPFVDLNGLLSICWGIGVPVIYLKVFPLPAKSMRAMIVRVDGRHAILLGRDSKYPAPVAFTLAHEIGHGALGHIREARALVDIGDSHADSEDEEEQQADAYGMELLTGSSQPEITTSIDNFGARGLAEAALKIGPKHGIEPGTLALCVGFIKGDWPKAMSSLKYIYSEQKDVWREVNGIAIDQFRWGALTEESAEYLQNIMTSVNG